MPDQPPRVPWSFVDATADSAVLVDPGGRVLYINGQMERLSGYTRDDLVGEPVERLLPADLVTRHRGHRTRYLLDGAASRRMGTGLDLHLRTREGTFLPVDIALTPVTTDRGPAVLAVIRDMSDRQALTVALAESERWLRLESDILELIARGAHIDTTLAAVATAIEGGTGGFGTIHLRAQGGDSMHLASAPTLPAEHAARLADVPNGDRPLAQALAAAAEGSGLHTCGAVPVSISTSGEVCGAVALHLAGEGPPPPPAVRLEAAARLVAIAVEHDRAVSALAHAAVHDALTGLPNRFLLLDRLAQALSRHRDRDAERVAVIFLDLDHFKVVNDSLGHSVGDRLLVDVASRLGETVRPGDTLARFGGDEFVLLCEGLTDDLQALAIAERVLDALRPPFSVEDRSVVVSASAGVSIDGRVTRGPEQMIREADSAMYRAKERGRGRVETFDAAMWERAMQRLALEAELRHAITAGELRVAYQAVVSLTSGAVVGAEALVRWAHPRRGLLLPDEFIPLAEETGLILPLGAWVLERACADAAAWSEAGHPELVVAVNVSVRQLTDADFAGRVRRTLLATGLEPSRLCVEVTESVFLDPAGPAAQPLRTLCELGVHVALDDFGTGYASLSSLTSVHADTVKIDTSFTSHLGDGDAQTERVLVEAVVRMARALGMNVVAEGVERRSQARSLSALGCPTVQGYLYSYPVDSDAFLALASQL